MQHRALSRAHPVVVVQFLLNSEAENCASNSARHEVTRTRYELSLSLRAICSTRRGRDTFSFEITLFTPRRTYYLRSRADFSISISQGRSAGEERERETEGTEGADKSRAHIRDRTFGRAHFCNKHTGPMHCARAIAATRHCYINIPTRFIRVAYRRKR